MRHAVQVAEPDRDGCFRVDAALARLGRRALPGGCAAADTLVVPAHFPMPTAGRIVRAGDAWRFAFTARA